MKERQYRKLIPRLFLLAAATLAPLSSARGMATSLPEPDSPLHKVIVIGFVGGFVRNDDAKHAEVKFAAHLRDRYASAVDVKVFGNHSGQQALRHVLSLLDTNRDGVLSALERGQAKIIIFGHSWGGTETVLLAHALQRQHIPVLLTIQVDSVAKPGQGDISIPANVAHAVNFYQSSGLLHGRSEILASDPERTNIIGNFHMTYKDHPINCDDFPWFARVFTKPHIEIENDPRVWAEAALLIDAELSGAQSIAQGPSVPAQ
jgi:acetyl esterase/lipase